MPLDSIRIEDMPDAGNEQPKDQFAFQRRVLGEWSDFYTDIETFMGGLVTYVTEWDGTNAWVDIIPAPSGTYLVPINVQAIFTPGNSPSGQTVQIIIEQPPVNNGYVMEFDDGSDSVAVQAYPIGAFPFEAGTDIQLTASTSLSLDFSGTAVIKVQYMVVEPV